ncbi:aspartate/glutamate racemase family protein [Acuticoccus sp. M5D2P5]|uniref:aspartate/glutamate racemase family protein n=1 Tax=Acuticoccus kalidii TaxID=2910977 RepID=UPI001F1BA9AD|nr:aspartate/glutamate racemase family protein [Acuticoccus kalidii]MCF3933546.1 aspartate/glutamate racemase family protein [Acuticoccus kalidii]
MAIGMGGTILLINPNSNPDVTAGMAEAVAPLALPGGPRFETMTLASGPFGVETQRDVEAVTLPLRDVVIDRGDVDAFVIACFSDPGLAVCREATTRPVLGIRECAVMSALMQGDRFGVVALGPASIKRQSRAFREMGVMDRWAGSGPLHLSVAAAEEASAFPRVLEVSRALVDDGADTILLGCAGMARHRAPLADALGVPVIEPTQAAAAHALGLVLLTAGAAAERAADAGSRAA